jgi:hypothetical protein
MSRVSFFELPWRRQIGNHGDAQFVARARYEGIGKELQSDREDGIRSAAPRWRVLLTARRLQFLLVSAIALIMVGGAVGGYMFGLNLTYRDLAAARAQLEQLLPESQRLKRAIIDENAKLVELQDKFTSVQAALQAIMPSENTYNISPNQSLIVAGGHLTIGLVGSPTNESVNININGKQQSAVSGDVIHIALDPSTSCQVGVQSFDMFKAVVTASCATVKP